MKIVKVTHAGFPYAWKAGRVEQLIIDILVRKAKEQLKVDTVMIMNPTWMHDDNIKQKINEVAPNFIICHNFADPAIPKIFEAVRESGIPYIIIGNASEFRLDFWAMVCDLNFQNYTESEIRINDSPKKFICLNRKPHGHRVSLVEALLPIRDHGYVSLGTPVNPILLDEQFREEQGIKDEFERGASADYVSNKIRNDIYSLGNLDIWRDSVLCLVTETEFGNPSMPLDFFISEKTFKPIIGMRPFFIYGNPKMREYLKEQGFDVFDDIFDYNSINEARDGPSRIKQYTQVAVDAINKIVNPRGKYLTLYGRCEKNKLRFRSYVYDQWDKLYRLDFNDFI